MKIYSIILGMLSAVAGCFYIYAKGSKAKENEIKAQAAEEALDYLNAGSEAIITGLNKEGVIRNESHSSDNRDHFE